MRLDNSARASPAENLHRAFLEGCRVDDPDVDFHSVEGSDCSAYMLLFAGEH